MRIMWNKLIDIISCLLIAGCIPAAAQNNLQLKQSSSTHKHVKVEPSYAWSTIQPLGLRKPASIDTLLYNYYQQAIPSEISYAWACTGNMGAEGINMLYMQRPQISDFFFRDALSTWIPSADKQKFYNTRIPMTLVSYNAGGGRENAQERLQTVFSGNINDKAQVGGNVDYLYSKGSYENQAAKDLVWGLNGSYMGDRYEFQGFYNHYNLLNKENGGITDDLYITDPAKLQGGDPSIQPKAIPTRLTGAHTRYVGGELYLNQRYKVGYWHEEEVNDTTVKRTYIPVSSFIWTLNYKHGRHQFRNDNLQQGREFFENFYLYPSAAEDRTSYTSLSNTVGISMLEGFHKYAKFGLAAYVTYEMRRYTQTPDTLDRSGDLEQLGLSPWPEGITAIDHKGSQNLAWVGAQITKQRGSILRYEATGELGIVGAAAGEVKARGTVSTHIPLLGDTVTVTGYGSFYNTTAPYLLNHYLSNHFIWQNDFGKERRLRFGGILNIPWTETSVNIGAENVQNLLYFNDACLPAQHGGSIQVFSATLDQRLKLGILHWDNKITYQTSSDETVLSLPKLAVYSNLYLQCKIATLHLQLGVDCDYYTKYYAPGYQPATATFHNQNEIKIGNYPFMTVYANMKLSKTRFYVMMTHINQGWFGRDYFSLPHYPLNPRRFQIGLSIDFAN